MNRKLFIPLTAIIVPLLLGACAGGNPQQYCDPNSLQPPIPNFPHDGGQYIVGQTIMTWSYQDQTCNPEGYRIEVDTINNFSGSVLGATSTFPNSSGWPLPIVDGVTYYWRVQATVGSTNGPWSVVYSFNGVLPCELSELVAPEPLGPWEGRTLFFDDPFYSWDYTDPACAPEGYHLQVSTDSAFATTEVDELLDDPAMGFKPSSTLSDCAIHYWRIAGMFGGADGPFSDPVSFYVSVDNLCPTPACLPTGLIAPDAIGPGGYEIVSSLTPTLEWDYPTYCEPEGFGIRLAPQFDLSSEPLQGGFGLTDSWVSGPLQPATQYRWDVAALVPPALGPFSNANSFFTGPECAFGDVLGPPILISPPNGAQIHEPYAWLHFNAGASVGCIPDGYWADLQTDPNFGGTNLLQTYSFPATNIITDPLQDCTEHFWRIAAIQDSIAGPWSTTGSFFTNVAGNCAISMIPEIPYAGAIRDLACLTGPNPQTYPIEGYLLVGESTAILAQNLMETWWVIQNPDGLPGDVCYIPRDGTTPSGDLSGIPRWNDPEVPTDESAGSGGLVCSLGLSQLDCIASGGTWIPNLTTPSSSYCDCN